MKPFLIAVVVVLGMAAIGLWFGRHELRQMLGTVGEVQVAAPVTPNKSAQATEAVTGAVPKAPEEVVTQGAPALPSLPPSALPSAPAATSPAVPRAGSLGVQVEEGAATTERGRVQIVDNTLVADNGVLLRGEHLTLADDSKLPGNHVANRMYNREYWRALRDDFHLNLIRLLISRPPQNYPGGAGDDCAPPVYRCYDLDAIFPGSNKTVIEVIDDMVNIASDLGMYIILDYHPVLGHNEADAIAWWSKIAPRYKDRTHVIYELANEPGGDEPDSPLVQFEEKLYKLIRSQAPDTHIILWSFANATGDLVGTVRQAQGISYANASVGYHPYGYDEGAVRALKKEYPVIASEIGEARAEKTAQAENLQVSWVWLNGANITFDDDFAPEDVYWPLDPAFQTTVAAPVITPDGGSYAAPVNVTITNEMPDVTIHYTIDGSPPTPASAVYTGTFTLASTTIVYARAYKDGLDSSAVVSATFAIGQVSMFLPLLLGQQAVEQRALASAECYATKRNIGMGVGCAGEAAWVKN